MPFHFLDELYRPQQKGAELSSDGYFDILPFVSFGYETREEGIQGNEYKEMIGGAAPPG